MRLLPFYPEGQMTDLDRVQRLEFLEERVSYLEESNQRFMSILEVLASSSEFQGDLCRAKDGAGIFMATISQLRRLFQFNSIGFLDSMDDGSFELVTVDPDGSKEILQALVEKRILDGTFAWALNRNQAVHVHTDGGETLVLQVVSTQSRVRGMFVGTLASSFAAMDAPSLNALTIVLYNCAYALESTYLYDMLHDHNQHLEERVEMRTRDLEVARRQAESASLAKSEFLAKMSHEIRTPMNGVLGMAELMLKGGLTPQKEQSYLRAINDSAESLMLIINDILDFSKIEAGRFTLEKIPFSPRDLLERFLAGLLVRIEEKGLRVIHRVADEVPDCLVGDHGRLRQILTNLVGNSIKFCKQGEIAVEVDLTSKDADSVMLHVRVTDTGIGISEEACQRIFNQFEQADGSTSRKYGGTGLGLAICKKLVELMDGEIWVESTPGVGSSFHFTAHFLIGNEELLNAESNTELADSHVEKVSLSILLADDVEINRALVLAILEPFGHKLECVTNGLQALEAYKAGNFDLVLMDVQMPEMDGLQAAREIRKFERDTVCGRPVPIVAMTAFAGSEDRHICIDAGMDEYLTKPIKSELLVKMVNKYSRNHSGNLSPEARQTDFDPTVQLVKTEQEQVSDVFAYDELLERLGGRDVMIPRFVGLFCKGFAPELEGLIAALSSGNTDGVRRHAHAIKGSAANIAALEINRTASQIEKAAKEGEVADIPQLLAQLHKEYNNFIEVVGSLGLS
jgi:signal transduction histidine kinase/DNA-binding response OmpR family regulator